jgi:type I protein arginine methyltransferase
MASPDLFPDVSFSDVSAGAAPAADGATAAFGVDATSGGPRLSLVRAGMPEVEPSTEIDLSDAQVSAVISVNVIWGGVTAEWLCFRSYA